MNQPKFPIDPKQFLWEMIINFSERTCLARWSSGIEFILWKKIRECSEDLTLRELADFNFYAGLANGWWMWDKNQKCEVFVKLGTWLEIYEANSKN
jgi:hypothetical protein